MKSSQSHIQGRRQRLLDYLKWKDYASTTELAVFLQTSETTIRRDLAIFEQEGLLIRCFGGAKTELSSPLSLSADSAAHERQQLKKEAIAQKMADLIDSYDTLFINSSSTACNLYRFLTGKPVTVITNNGNSLLEKRDTKVSLILTGGDANRGKGSLTGEYALDTLTKITANKCIIGVSGISVEEGLTTSLLPETTINSTMIRRCNGPVYVLADSSKIGVKHNFHSGNISCVSHLITDKDANPEELEKLRAAGVDVILVNV